VRPCRPTTWHGSVSKRLTRAFCTRCPTGTAAGCHHRRRRVPLPPMSPVTRSPPVALRTDSSLAGRAQRAERVPSYAPHARATPV
jgi:hypothetical protein